MGVAFPRSPESRPLWLEGLLTEDCGAREPARVEEIDDMQSVRDSDGVLARCDRDAGVPDTPSRLLESHDPVSSSPTTEAERMTGICMPDRLAFAISASDDGVNRSGGSLESGGMTTRKDAPSDAAAAAASCEETHTPNRYDGSDRTCLATTIGTPAPLTILNGEHHTPRHW